MRTLARIAVAMALLAIASGRTPVHAANELEYPVKTEILERFTRFIDWPSQSFSGPDGPFVMCIAGDSPMEPYLQQLARERRIKERQVELRKLRPGADPSGCHVLYVGAGERAHLKQLLARVDGKPILTVADTEGFAREGVLINFVFDEEGRVRFEICSTRLKHSGLTFSAQLLRLARLVEEQP